MKKMAVVLLQLLIPLALSAQNLSLSEYLSQVENKNEAVRASKNISLGTRQRAKDYLLLTTANFFATASVTDDAKPTGMTAFLGEKTKTNLYSLGISQNTDFGLSGKLGYNLMYTSIEGATMVTQPQYHTAYPSLELSQSIWRNSSGEEVKAQKAQIESGALATSYLENFKVKSQLVEAEAGYWRLVIAREAVNSQKDALERAKKITEWAERRVKTNLSDRSILLQTQAAYTMRKLDYQVALDEEKASARTFNSLRGDMSESVTEKLERINEETINRLSVPQRAKLRDDVKAAQELQRVAQASAQAAMEKDTPSLDVFANLALNAKEDGMSTAMQNSLKTDHKTTTVGLKFSAPLDFELLKNSRDAYRREEKGAELNYQRKVFEQEVAWLDLTTKFAEAKRKLILAFEMEKAQKEKWTYEQNLLQRGRSTTSQVLTFEQDFELSQLNRIRAQGAVLTIYAQMKLFAGE